jgi:hypothetical protein
MSNITNQNITSAQAESILRDFLINSKEQIFIFRHLKVHNSVAICYFFLGEYVETKTIKDDLMKKWWGANNSKTIYGSSLLNFANLHVPGFSLNNCLIIQNNKTNTSFKNSVPKKIQQPFPQNINQTSIGLLLQAAEIEAQINNLNVPEYSAVDAIIVTENQNKNENSLKLPPYNHPLLKGLSHTKIQELINQGRKITNDPNLHDDQDHWQDLQPKQKRKNQPIRKKTKFLA